MAPNYQNTIIGRLIFSKDEICSCVDFDSELRDRIVDRDRGQTEAMHLRLENDLCSKCLSVTATET